MSEEVSREIGFQHSPGDYLHERQPVVHLSMEEPVVKIDEFKGVAPETGGESMSDEVTDIAEDGAFTAVVPE